eukprot:4531792-Alexandrium_andersonii.AAC.1
MRAARWARAAVATGSRSQCFSLGPLCQRRPRPRPSQRASDEWCVFGCCSGDRLRADAHTSHAPDANGILP